MKRTERIPGQREAVLAALRRDRQPPAGANLEVMREWACRQLDRGWSDGQVAVALGWTVDQVRAAIAERRG